MDRNPVAQIGALTDEELEMLIADAEHTIANARQELLRRAGESDDPASLAEHAFTVGFDANGMAKMPWLAGRFLIVPGAKVARSANTHRCRFGAVDGDWVWNSTMCAEDQIRPGNTHGTMQAITVLAWYENMEVEVVDSKATGREHKRVKTRKVVVVGGELMVEDTATSQAPTSHR